MMTNVETFFLDAGLGLVGGLVAVIVKEKGCFTKPSTKDGKVYLGSLTGILLGIVAGVVGDNTPINAFIWGIGGSTIITGLVHNVDEGAKKLGSKCYLDPPKENKQDDKTIQ